MTHDPKALVSDETVEAFRRDGAVVLRRCSRRVGWPDWPRGSRGTWPSRGRWRSITPKNRPGARNLILVSWLLPIALIPIAMLFGPLLDASGFGTVLRLAACAAGSGLAMLAVARFVAVEPPAN